MKRTHIAAGIAAVTIAGFACTNDEAREGMTKVSLESLPGVEAWVPPNTEVSKNALGVGVMLTGPGVSMTIGPALADDAATLDEATDRAATYAATDLEGESLRDGYILTYRSKGETGVNYWLVGRRELANRDYTCGVSSPKQEHQRSAIAICKSLTK